MENRERALADDLDQIYNFLSPDDVIYLYAHMHKNRVREDVGAKGEISSRFRSVPRGSNRQQNDLLDVCYYLGTLRYIYTRNILDET